VVLDWGASNFVTQVLPHWLLVVKKKKLTQAITLSNLCGKGEMFMDLCGTSSSRLPYPWRKKEREKTERRAYGFKL
jgi:hypothetical protein